MNESGSATQVRELQVIAKNQNAAQLVKSAQPQLIPVPGTGMKVPFIVGPPVYVEEGRSTVMLTSTSPSVNPIATETVPKMESKDEIVYSRDTDMKNTGKRNNMRLEKFQRIDKVGMKGNEGSSLITIISDGEEKTFTPAPASSMNKGVKKISYGIGATANMGNSDSKYEEKPKRGRKKNTLATAAVSVQTADIAVGTSDGIQEDARLDSGLLSNLSSANKTVDGLHQMPDSCLNLSEAIGYAVNADVNSMLDANMDVLELSDSDNLLQLLSSGDTFKGPGLLSSVSCDDKKNAGASSDEHQENRTVASGSVAKSRAPNGNQQKNVNKGSERVSVESELNGRSLLKAKNVKQKSRDTKEVMCNEIDKELVVKSSFGPATERKIPLKQNSSKVNSQLQKSAHEEGKGKLLSGVPKYSRHMALEAWNRNLWSQASELKKPAPAHQHPEDDRFKTINIQDIGISSSVWKESAIDLRKFPSSETIAQLDGVNDSCESERDERDLDQEAHFSSDESDGSDVLSTPPPESPPANVSSTHEMSNSNGQSDVGESSSTQQLMRDFDSRSQPTAEGGECSTAVGDERDSAAGLEKEEQVEMYSEIKTRPSVNDGEANSPIVISSDSTEEDIERDVTGKKEKLQQEQGVQTINVNNGPSDEENSDSGSMSTVYTNEENYYKNNDSFTEYQPERNVFFSSTDSDILCSLKSATSTEGYSADESETEEKVADKGACSNIALSTADQKECKKAIAECDQLLAPLNGSHLEMSTITVESSGSLNTTTDLLGGQIDLAVVDSDISDNVLDEDCNKSQLEKKVQISAEESKGKASITLDDLVNDKNFDIFQSGISTTSTPKRPDGSATVTDCEEDFTVNKQGHTYGNPANTEQESRRHEADKRTFSASSAAQGQEEQVIAAKVRRQKRSSERMEVRSFAQYLNLKKKRTVIDEEVNASPSTCNTEGSASALVGMNTDSGYSSGLMSSSSRVIRQQESSSVSEQRLVDSSASTQRTPQRKTKLATMDASEIAQSSSQGGIEVNVSPEPFSSFTKNIPARNLLTARRGRKSTQKDKTGQSTQEKSATEHETVDEAAGRKQTAIKKRRWSKVKKEAERDDEENTEKKCPKKSRSSCQEDWIKDRLLREDSDDDSEKRGNTTQRSRGKIVEASKVKTDVYAFDTEAANNDGGPTGGRSKAKKSKVQTDDSHTSEGAMSFVNPVLSDKLGHLNNPFNSSGWVKTRCGMSGSSMAEKNTEGDVLSSPDTTHESPGPMWGVVTAESSDEETMEVEDEKFEDVYNDYNVSDVEKGEALQNLTVQCL